MDEQVTESGVNQLPSEPATKTNTLDTVQVVNVLAQAEGIRESVTEMLRQIGESKGVAEQAAQEAKSKLDALKLVSDAIAATASEIDGAHAKSEEKVKAIQAAQADSEKVRSDLTKLLATAANEVTGMEGLKTRGQAASDDAVRIAAEMSAAKTTSDTSTTAITEALRTSQQAAKDAKGLADRAGSIESKLKEYEDRLSELLGESDRQLKTILSLLPGATSAGLAHAFDARAETFKVPQRHWQSIFIGSLFALIALGISGAWHALFSHVALSYDELVRLWLARLPVAAALLWLTLHAAREAALAKRLEEDYGYKAAVASSFEEIGRAHV